MRVQLDLHADDYETIERLAEAIRLRADGYRGTVSIDGYGSVVIQNVELADEASGYENPNDGSDIGPFSYRMDFRISALEPIPTPT